MEVIEITVLTNQRGKDALLLYPGDHLGNLGSKTAYERVHRGVMWTLWHHHTPGIVSLNRIHVLALFEFNTLLYGITTGYQHRIRYPGFTTDYTMSARKPR